MKQTTDEVIMIRPGQFYMNPETAIDNAYQNDSDEAIEDIQAKALIEFDNLVANLRDEGIKVNVIEDNKQPSTPDSIFPNNWFSTHEDGSVIIYPMLAKNRQEEVGKFEDAIIDIIRKKDPTRRIKVSDYRNYLNSQQYLEGTGAMVLDRQYKIIYCSLSQRADEQLVSKLAEDINHKLVTFHANQDNIPVYHTNVVMGIGENIALVALDLIDEDERVKVKASLENTGKQIIEISGEQVKNFLGNTLELKGSEGPILVMSLTAYNSLKESQKNEIEKYVKIVPTDISTIEYYGGGSVRCTIAEVF